MMSARKIFFVGACATMIVATSGTTFLRSTPKHEAARVSKEDVENSLLSEIEGSLGTGIGSKRVNDMKGVLSPMYAALPKNSYGNLEHVTVTYALHRVFVQRHGWSIKGLDHAGAGWNSSTATGILKDQVPAFIQDLFEQRLGGRGLGLHELAVFAATIEHLVHNEAVGRLGSTLNLHGLLPTALMTEKQVDEILDTYMMAYILGENLKNMTLEDAQALINEMPEIFLAWGDTQKFVREVRQKLAKEEQSISFALLVKIAETIGEQFGKFQDAECKGLKAALVKMEDRGTGRVRLSDFYKPAANGAASGNSDGSWQFQESVGYLRQLGILDESNSDEPRVMLSNYLTSQANCIASSDYYSVCCIDECEDLFSHLEKSLAAPEATTSEIVKQISALPSSSVAVPRTLSDTLLTRLGEIAASHGGKVQLHGRLFAQWMHHAYPRECPYPHMSGVTSQESADSWSNDNRDAVATQDELEQFISASNSTDTNESVDDIHDLMMWSHEEELLIARPPFAHSVKTGLIARVLNVILIAALASVVLRFAHVGFTSSGVVGDKSEKYMV